MILFASDYDNTLYFPEKGFLSSDLYALNRFVSEGNCFALATGRSYHSVLKSSVTVALPVHYWVCANGAAVFDQTHLLQRKTLGHRKIQEVLHYAQDCDAAAYEFGDGIDSFILKTDSPDALSDRINAVLQNYFSGINKIIQIGFAFHTPQQLDKCRRQLEHVSGISLHINSLFIDITDHSASKENAVSFLKDQCGAEKVCTLGDDWNDLGMLERFDGYLMDSSPEALKRRYQKTVSSAAECLSLLQKEANYHTY